MVRCDGEVLDTNKKELRNHTFRTPNSEIDNTRFLFCDRSAEDKIVQHSQINPPLQTHEEEATCMNLLPL